MQAVKARLTITAALVACIALGQGALAQPAAAAPAAGEYVCSDFQLKGQLDQTSSSASEAFHESGTTSCTAGAASYPSTTLTIDGTAVVTCGAGIVVTGTLTISDGQNPAVTTPVFLTFDKTGSRSGVPDPGTMTLGSGQYGAVSATMSTGVPLHLPTDDLCDSAGWTLVVTINGSFAPGNGQTAMLDNGVWAVYHDADVLTDTAFSVVQGTSVTGGTTDDTTGDCDVPDPEITLNQGGSSAKDVREVAFNPITCQFVEETGVPSPSVVAADNAKDASAPGKIDESSVDTTPVHYGFNKTHAYWRTWYQDYPAGIDVAVVGVGTSWYWSYPPSVIYPPVVNTVHYHKYDTSGWGLFQHDWQQGYDSTKTTSSVYAHFANGSWPGCRGHETHIVFNRTHVHGYYDGHIYAATHSYKRGLNVVGCLKSLRWRHRLQADGAGF